jgi:RNA polymerase sigma-70 factor (ECF subfamily)
MAGSARDQRLHSEDLELAAGCVRGDPVALRLFETRLLSLVPQFLSRFDGSGALCDEVAQEMRAELLVPSAGKPPGISAYSGRGDLAAWLRIVAIRTALRLRKAENRPPPEGSDPLLGAGAPELDYLKLRYRGACEEAFRGALATLSSRERLYLRLHYVEGLSIDRMASLYRVHRSTIARRLAAHREKLHQETRARLRERLKVSDSEFESLIGLVRSQLLVSIRGALASSGR